MDIIQESPEKIIVEFKNCATPLLSALRRVVIAEVPTVAIDTVDFIENTSIFPDEYIAHRLGLIVLESTKLCDYVLSINYTAESSKTFLSGDLVTNDTSIIVHKNVPILKLEKGQRIRLQANTRVSTGLEHSKWSPVCPAFVNGNSLIIESTGALPPRMIIERGLKVLMGKLKGIDFE